MSEGWLNLLGLARRAGQMAPGENQTSLAMRRQQVALLVMAEDAGPSLYRKYHLWAQDLHVPLVIIGTKAQLGGAIGMGPHAVLAVLDEGFGRRILEELGKSSGGIILDRKRQRQDQGVRAGQRVETRQSPTHRPAPSSESGQYQKSHEHGRTGRSQDGARHHGGKASARTQTGTQADSAQADSAQADTATHAERAAPRRRPRTGHACPHRQSNGRPPSSRRTE